MQRNELLWKCPLRTKAKLEIITNYLSAWFSILARNGFRHVYYIDGFSGPGKYSDGPDGSPTIAASIANRTALGYPGFKATLIFADEDPNVLEHLKTIDSIKNHHPNVTIQIEQGKFSDLVNKIIAILKKNPKSPTFSFIDPFGFKHSPFRKIKELMHNTKSEIFINFMCGFMNRFKEHPSEDMKNQIMQMLGHDSLEEIVHDADPINRFCSIYERKLKGIAPYTLKFMMRDENNIRDNCFFFCGSNARGFEKIKEAMWKVDPYNGNSFSAYEETKKDGNQSDFFDLPIPHTRTLSRMILDEFGGKSSVQAGTIFKWVIESTETFLPKHAREALEDLNDEGMIEKIADPNPNPRKRRRNNWPERLVLSFKPQ